MSSSMRSGAVWKQIRQVFGLGTLSGLSERELLRRFRERRDEAAFAALVALHGSMVVGVCRRLLDDPEDVEDAFQAAFLVLARRAHILRPRAAIGPWLHGVAYRVALKARTQALRRRNRERVVAWSEDSAPAAAEELVASAHRDDLARVLDEEIGRLPGSYRAVMVLCYLEGRTHEQAAERLRWPLGTVKGRLSRAREMLKGRIARRGLTPALVAFEAIATQDASAMVPESWIATAAEAAMEASIATGGMTTALVSANAAILAEETLALLFRDQAKAAILVLVAVAASAAGAGTLLRGDRDAKPALGQAAPEPAPALPVAPAPAAAPAPKTREAEAAMALRVEAKPQLEKAEMSPFRDAVKADNPVFARGYQLAFKAFREGNADIEAVHLWSRRLAEGDLVSGNADRKARALEKHRERMDQVQLVAKDRNQRRPSDLGLLEHLSAQLYRDEAETLANAPIVAAIAAPRAPADPTPRAAANQLKSLAILKTLDQQVAMNFAEATPLDAVLKHVKASTRSPEFPRGIDIYVDPIGLKEVAQSLDARVTIDLAGVPLRRTLTLILGQLGLRYQVREDMILITNAARPNFDSLEPNVGGESRLVRTD